MTPTTPVTRSPRSGGRAASRRTFVSIAALLVGAAATVNPAHSRPSDEPVPPVADALDAAPHANVLGQLGGATTAVALVGRDAELLLAGVGPRVVVYDVSDPDQPRAVAQSDVLGGIVRDIAAEGSVAIASTGVGGWCAFDLSGLPAFPEAACDAEHGHAHGVAVAGRWAYVAAGPDGLKVLDLAVPQLPRAAALVRPGLGNIVDVAVAGDYAYVVDDHSGLIVLDIASPQSPRQVAAFDTGRGAAAVAVDGARAYVLQTADIDPAIEIVDVSDPRSPTRVGRLLVSDTATDLEVVGSIVYVTDEVEGLTLADVRDPLAPVLLGYHRLDGGARAVSVAGDNAFVASARTGLAVIDIADVQAPVLVAKFGNPIAHFVLRGSLLFGVEPESGTLRILDVGSPNNPRPVGMLSLAPMAAADPPISIQDIALDVDRVYAATSDKELVVVDVTSPAAPVEAIRMELPDHVKRLAAANGAVYAATAASGVLIFDARRAGVPQRVASIAVDDVNDVAVVRSQLYVGARDGLRIYDVGTPAVPKLLGEHSTLPATVDDVLVAGDRAYLTGSGDGFFVRLAVVDVRDPSRPVLLDDAALPMDVGAYRVDVRGDFAFVAAAEWGAYVFDVADPRRIEEVAVMDVSGSTLDLVGVGDHLLVSDSEEGLRIFELAELRAPKLIGLSETLGDAVAVVESGGYAYVTAGTRGLHVVDVREPGRPRQTGWLALPGGASGIDKEGDTVVVAAGPAGLQVIDASSPAGPTLVAGIRPDDFVVDGPHWVNDVRVRGGIAFAACYQCGLWVVDVSNPAAPRHLGQAGGGRGGQYDMAVSLGDDDDARVYLAGTEGIRIYDTADTAVPKLVHNVRSLGTLLDVDVRGRWASVAGASDLFATIDVQDPETPKVAGTLPLAAKGLSVVGMEGRAVVATGSADPRVDSAANLSFIDVGNPSELHVAHGIALAGHPASLDAAGDIIYTANRDGGLWVIGQRASARLDKLAFVPLARTAAAP